MIFYVDYENTYESGLQGMEFLGEEDSIYLFYSNSVPNITKRFRQIADERNIEIKVRKLKEVKKNGLDFYIATQLGADISSTQSYAIISKDTGYQAVKDYWEVVSPQKYTINLGESIFDILVHSQDDRAAYLQEGKERIPVECFNRKRVKEFHVNKTQKDDLIIKEKSNTEDKIKELSDSFEQLGQREAYNYAIQKFGTKEGPELYRQMKKVRTADAKASVDKLITKGEKVTKDNLMIINTMKNIKPELVDACKTKGMYGQIEFMAIATSILNLKKEKIAVNEITDYLTAAGQYDKFTEKPDLYKNYQGAFLGVKISEIMMIIKQFAKTEAIKVVDNVIYVIDEEILRCFAFPEAFRYQNNEPRENYHDIDWIAEIRNEKEIADDQWKWRYGLFQRSYLLLVHKDLIADYMKKAPSSCREYLEKIYKREKNGYKKNSIQYILAKSRPLKKLMKDMVIA